MKKGFKNAEAQGLFINMAIVAIILICALIIYFIKGFSWFTGNKTPKAEAPTLMTIGAAIGTVNLYEYDDISETLFENPEVILNLYPTMNKTFVIMYSNDSTSAVNFSYSFNDISVNYYALQQFTQKTALNSFLQQYIQAGPYINTANNNSLDFMSITTEQYLSFVHPCSNAIKVKVSQVVIPSEVYVTTDYVAGLISSESIIYGDLQTLLASGHGVTSVAENASEDKIYILDENMDSYQYYDLSGVPATFDNAELDAGGRMAVVINFSFDKTVCSQSVIGSDTIELQNSNPFMYQRLKIGKVKCETSIG